MDGAIVLIVFVAVVLGAAYWIYSVALNAARIVRIQGVGELWNVPSIKFLITIIAIVVTITSIYFISTRTNLLDRGSSTPNDESSMAFVQCQSFVKNRLKAPSTADFAFLDYSAKTLPNRTFQIKSYVDAQNSFGAKIRNYFLCEIQWSGADSARIDNWNLINLELSE